MPPKSDNRRRKSNREPREAKEFEEYMLQLDRVTRVVKGGRRMRFRATAIIGDRAGRVGLGLGKGNDVQIAMRKAVAVAKKHIITVPIVNDTLPHAAKLKFKAARLLVMPATAGTGILAGGAIRKILELAGVKNILSKNIGTSNRVVVAQATMKLLQGLRMTEAAKKFVAELKKTSETAKKKSAAAREESDRGPRTSGRKTTEKDGQTGLKATAKKLVEKKEEGRLEKEIAERK
jgi:small subunit ribosomal protein S5